MLEYTGMSGKIPIKMFFVDEKSPNEWTAVINYKLSNYNENAYIDTKTNGSKDILIILELNPNDNQLENGDYILEQKDAFEKYYDDILEDIGSSNQSLNE